MGLQPHYIAKKEMIKINEQTTTKVEYPKGKYIMKIEQKKKQYGLKTDIIIIDDLISNDGVSKETAQAVIDFIKNKKWEVSK